MSDETPEINVITWTIWPEDVLDSLDVLLVYLGVNKNLMRPPVIAPVNHRKPQENQVPMRRALGRKAMQAAVTLLLPCRRHPIPQHGQHWCINPRFDHRDRLASAGIDMDTVQIFDRRKFAFAWKQLTEAWAPHYSRDKQDKALAVEGAPVPPINALVRTIPKKESGKSYKLALRKPEDVPTENWSLGDRLLEKQKRGF